MSPKYPPVLFSQSGEGPMPQGATDQPLDQQTAERQRLRQELLRMIVKNEAQRYHRAATK